MLHAGQETADVSDIAIVGAGTAGLTLAILLGRKGWRVTVVEKRQVPGAPVRGEILQPNGLAMLDRMGLLTRLHTQPHAPTERYHFCRIGRGPMVTFDYRELPCEHPTTIVLLPQALHNVMLDELVRLPNVELVTGTRFVALVKNGAGHVTGISVMSGAATRTISARLVVGADGAASAVRRAMGVETRTHTYPEGYLTGLIPRPAGFERDGYYYLGKREILGLFPVAADTLYFFYLLPLAELGRYRAMDLRWLTERIGAIHPPLRPALAALQSWKDLSFSPCLKVRVGRWYRPGVALIGDAAHAANPHVAQGRNLALLDAWALAEAAEDVLRDGLAIHPLRRYERQRQAEAERFVRLGDELVTFWNTGHPLLALLRDRGFRSLSRVPTLRGRVMKHIAGLSPEPLSPFDRVRLALGG